MNSTNGDIFAKIKPLPPKLDNSKKNHYLLQQPARQSSLEVMRSVPEGEESDGDDDDDEDEWKKITMRIIRLLSIEAVLISE
jgi:hypothetical protein